MTGRSRSISAAARDPEGPPPAPWGSFPLVEISVLTGLVLLVWGFFFAEGERGVLLIVAGLAIASLAGLELAIREHVAGYRSHTLVLAAAPAVAALGVLFYAVPEGALAAPVRVAIGALVFGGAALAFTAIFRQRSGGYTFRVRDRRRR